MIFILFQMLKHHYKHLYFLKMERKMNTPLLNCGALTPQTRSGNNIPLAPLTNCLLSEGIIQDQLFKIKIWGFGKCYLILNRLEIPHCESLWLLRGIWYNHFNLKDSPKTHTTKCRCLFSLLFVLGSLRISWPCYLV